MHWQRRFVPPGRREIHRRPTNQVADVRCQPFDGRSKPHRQLSVPGRKRRLAIALEQQAAPLAKEATTIIRRCSRRPGSPHGAYPARESHWRSGLRFRGRAAWAFQQTDFDREFATDGEHVDAARRPDGDKPLVTAFTHHDPQACVLQIGEHAHTCWRRPSYGPPRFR